MRDMTKENLINFFTTAIDIVNGKPVCETCEHRKMDYQKKEVICDIHNMTIDKMGSYCNLYKKDDSIFNQSNDTEIKVDQDKRNGNMTYGDIIQEFIEKFPNTDYEDIRPCNEMYGVPNINYAIVVWLKDKSKIIYISDKAREYDEHMAAVHK